MDKQLSREELDGIAADFAADLAEAEKTPGSTGYKAALYAGQRTAERFRDHPAMFSPCPGTEPEKAGG